VAFEQVEFNGEKYYYTRITASLRTATAHEVAKASSFTEEQIQQAAASLADSLGDGIPKTPDVSYLKGIYVSSGMNSNWDVFLPTELARSYGTIRLKPLDVEHVIEEGSSYVEIVKQHPNMTFNSGKNTIIGAIYDAAMVSSRTGAMVPASNAANGIAEIWDDIQASENDLLKNYKEHEHRSRYDIVMAGVLWKWLFPKTVADITNEVNSGERALSMEVYFRDYDWFVNGTIYNKDEAPHLADAFRKGGFNGMPVGRVLRGMIFGGGGLVANPANPNALNFIEVAPQHPERPAIVVSASLQKKEAKSDELPTNGEQDNSEKKTNTDTGGNPMPIDKETLDQIKATLDEVSEAKANLKVAQAENKSLQTTVDTLQKEIASLKEAASAATEQIKTLTTDLEAVKASVAEKDQALEAAKTEAAEKDSKVEELEGRAKAAEEKIAAFEQAELLTKRIASLEEADVLLDAEADAKAVASLSDDDFEAFKSQRVALKEKLAKASDKTEDKKDDEKVEDKKTEAAEKSVTFPVIDGQTETHRALASAMASDPKTKDRLSKYSLL